MLWKKFRVARRKSRRRGVLYCHPVRIYILGGTKEHPNRIHPYLLAGVHMGLAARRTKPYV